MPSLISPIVGHQFRPLPDKAALATSAPGSPLILSPEPNNKVDPNAIKVLTADAAHHLGYIPSSLNPRIDFTKYASNLTVLSVLSGAPDHTADLEFDLDGNPYVNLSWS